MIYNTRDSVLHIVKIILLKIYARDKFIVVLLGKMYTTVIIVD